jgi:hypothetical protein
MLLGAGRASAADEKAVEDIVGAGSSTDSVLDLEEDGGLDRLGERDGPCYTTSRGAWALD